MTRQLSVWLWPAVAAIVIISALSHAPAVAQDNDGDQGATTSALQTEIAEQQDEIDALATQVTDLQTRVSGLFPPAETTESTAVPTVTDLAEVPTPTEEAAMVTATEAAPDPTATEQATAPARDGGVRREAIQLRGTGQRATRPFSLRRGITRFHATHNGQGNFAIELFDAGGAYIDLLVNEIGPFKGGGLTSIEDAGEFVIQVTADGGWTITVDQSVPADADRLPQRLSGAGPRASRFLRFDSGVVRFAMTHNGEGNFAIELYDATGDYVDLLVNEVGPFDGSKVVTIDQAGLFILNITAGGRWTIAIK